jgi:hypothetical protein
MRYSLSHSSPPENDFDCFLVAFLFIVCKQLQFYLTC